MVSDSNVMNNFNESESENAVMDDNINSNNVNSNNFEDFDNSNEFVSEMKSEDDDGLGER